LATVARTGRFGDLIPPTNEELGLVLNGKGTKLAEIIGLPSDSEASAYTNHIPWSNIDDIPEAVSASPTKLSELENDLNFITN